VRRWRQLGSRGSVGGEWPVGSDDELYFVVHPEEIFSPDSEGKIYAVGSKVLTITITLSGRKTFFALVSGHARRRRGPAACIHSRMFPNGY
jgi:hypothetical protein